MAMLGSSVIYNLVYSSDSSILQKRAGKKQHQKTKNLLKHLKICNTVIVAKALLDNFMHLHHNIWLIA